MPVYDYKCQQCEKVSEILVRSSDSKAIRCPSCGSGQLERLVSASYLVRTETRAPGTTCCGRTERCETPPCSTGDVCQRRLGRWTK
ncbi:MAG TPA: zinc ribbon domain-containing protein [Dehalococcoidia bacterium]|nr:zinc ribbon domain-containing protein [Dehalococcoidia bacterium]